MSRIEGAAIVVVCFLSVVVLFWSLGNYLRNVDQYQRAKIREFQAACSDAGGAAAWDGRQYQCLKK